MELHQKIQIALVGVEIVPRRRPEQIEPLHAPLPAEPLNGGAFFIGHNEHARIIPRSNPFERLARLLQTGWLE